MYIYLPEVKQKEGEALDYLFEENLSEWFDDFSEGDSITLQVSVSSSLDKVLINGSFNAVIQAVCSRCLENFEHHLKADFTEVFNVLKEVPTGSTPDSLAVETANMYTVTGDYLYLDEYIRQLIILAQEHSPLCKADCKGICAGCGTDLNNSSCSCNMDDEAIDIRLLKLKELKQR